MCGVAVGEAVEIEPHAGGTEQIADRDADASECGDLILAAIDRCREAGEQPDLEVGALRAGRLCRLLRGHRSRILLGVLLRRVLLRILLLRVLLWVLLRRVLLWVLLR